MADYNVNMKQWNGSSFDNVLPLAYLANDASKLEGKTYTEILAVANQYTDGKIAPINFVFGVYTGNGKKMSDGGKKITVGFKPQFLIVSSGVDEGQYLGSHGLWIGGEGMVTENLAKVLKFQSNGFTVGDSVYNSSGWPALWLNTANSVYGYIAFGS